jgi:hypothetical protein
VGQAKKAGAFTAVIRLPVSVADTHIVRGALSVAIATVGALSINDAREGGQRGQYQHKLKHSQIQRFN